MDSDDETDEDEGVPDVAVEMNENFLKPPSSSHTSSNDDDDSPYNGPRVVDASIVGGQQGQTIPLETFVAGTATASDAAAGRSSASSDTRLIDDTTFGSAEQMEQAQPSTSQEERKE